MADFYKVLKADPLGEPYTPSQPGAKPIQNYWCQVEGQDWAVNIGRQTDNPLTHGTHVYGDLTYAKSQKGTEYWKFKSQKVPEDVQRPADTPAQAAAQRATGQVPNASDAMPGWFIPINNMIKYIYEQMQKMDDEYVPPSQPAKMPVSKVDDAVLSDVKVDDVTEEQLADLFPDEPVPEDV
jgi:hypothetical protein